MKKTFMHDTAMYETQGLTVPRKELDPHCFVLIIDAVCCALMTMQLILQILTACTLFCIS